MTHEPGFYWVKYFNNWHVVEYDSLYWFRTGEEEPIDPDDFSQILGPILPPDHTP